MACIFHSLNVHHINWFIYIKPSLHPRDSYHLIMAYNLFVICCWIWGYLQLYSSVLLACRYIFLWPHRMSLKAFLPFLKKSSWSVCISLEYLTEYSWEAIWSWAFFLLWNFWLLLKSFCLILISSRFLFLIVLVLVSCVLLHIIYFFWVIQYSMDSSDYSALA